MRICQNGPLDKFMQFLFMRSSTLCKVIYGTIKNLCRTNLCDQIWPRIIRINKTHAKNVTLQYVSDYTVVLGSSIENS